MGAEMTEENTTPEPKQTALFQEMLAASGWTPESGPDVGIFENKPRGHRCLWSCKWGTQFGLVEPADLLKLEDMTSIQLLWEAADATSRAPQVGVGGSGNEGAIREAMYAIDAKSPGREIAILRFLLEQERLIYPEYVFPDMPPPRARLGHLIVRDGWGDSESIFAKAMEVQSG